MSGMSGQILREMFLTDDSLNGLLVSAHFGEPSGMMLEIHTAIRTWDFERAKHNPPAALNGIRTHRVPEIHHAKHIYFSNGVGDA